MLRPGEFALQMTDNTRLMADSYPWIGVDPDLLVDSVDLLPNDCVRGNIVFQIPRGKEPRFVVFSGRVGRDRWIAKWDVRTVAGTRHRG